MTKVRRVLSNGFCSKFHTLSSSAKIFENRLRFDKVIESLKVRTFLRHSVFQKSAFHKTEKLNPQYFAISKITAETAAKLIHFMLNDSLKTY